MTPSDMAAVWSRIPRALPKHYRKYKKPPKRKRDAGQIESDVRNLLEITTNSVGYIPTQGIGHNYAWEVEGYTQHFKGTSTKEDECVPAGIV